MPGLFDDFLSEQQYGFRKGYSVFLSLLEKWKNSVDKRKSFGTLLTDFSKTFRRLFSTMNCLLLN